MNGDYTIYERSMNGVKVLSDGVSFISDGTATHQKIFYTDTIESSPDGFTKLDQNSVTTINVNCDTLTATNTNATNLDANLIDSLRLRINDASNNIIYDFNGNNSTATFNGVSNFNNTINVTNKNIVQTQTGEINQSGTGTNDFKDSNINGFLVVGSNITQSGGSTSLKDLTCDQLTLRSGKSITQSGTGVSNTLAGTTTVSDLIIVDSVVFPANVTVPGTTTTDDIVMEDDSIIIQDLTVEPSGKTNILRNTKTLDLEVDGDLDMIKSGSTATLKNTIVQGTLEVQGDITQTTGSTVLKTISCNNITLNADQIITMSGTGYITQSGTGTNTLKAIELTNNSNLTFNGNGIISQPLNTSQNILNNFRCAGYGIVGGRNNTTYSNTQNIQNNNGLQLQFNRDNSTQYSFIMNNRGSGGNGGFRFQRYVTGVYVDEPLTIDDNITMNKNLSIPGGSLSCATATLGNISQTELDCLDNCNTNIQTKFNTLDSEIANLQASSSGNTTALTGISYVSATDTTLVDNNLTVSANKNLLVGTRNLLTEITANATNITTLLTRTTDMTYASATDTTNFNNNVRIGYNKKLYIGDMDVEAEITALETSITTGNIDTTNLITTNLTVTGTAQFDDLITVTNSVTTGNLTTDTIYNNGETSLYGTVFIYNNSNLEISGFIRSKGVLNVGTVYNLTTTQTLSFPLNEYNIGTTTSFITVTLPVVDTTDKNNIVVNFILNNQSGKITLQNSAGTNFFDINGNSIATFILQNGSYISATLMSKNNSWYVIDFVSPKAISGVSLSLSQNAVINGTLNVVGNSEFNGYHEVDGIIATDSNFRLNNRTNLGVAVNQNTNITLSFPVNEYYVVTQSNVAISITLPNITNLNQNDAFTTFILNSTLSTCTINKPTSTLLFDINKNSVNSIQLTATTYLNVKVMAIESNWYVVDLLNNQSIINSNLAVKGNIKSKALVPGYMFDGANSFLTYPIPCSMKGFRPGDVDDYYYLNPGFKFEIYENDNYSGTIQYTLTNDGGAPTVLAANTANKVGSIKVFYRDTSNDIYTEITMPFIS